jgi:YQGE family putative transporter
MRQQLDRKASVALTLNALYSAAEGLCSVFVSVYLWINSQDFLTVCWYHVTIYFVTPFFFILAGWYSQARDRLHMYRLGLVLHAVFYATLLSLGEHSGDYPVALGALLGVTWGVYWAGANTFNYDVTTPGRREYYIGLVMAVSGAVSLLAPLLSGFIIRSASMPQRGYRMVFAIVLGLYVLSLALSFLLPRDNVRRPFRIARALFPRKDQRDWQLMMLASASMSGSFNIFPFVLGLLMYMRTGNELSVGGYASLQALAGVVVAFIVARIVTPRTRRPYMFWGLIVLVAAGCLMAFEVTATVLIVFGLLRSISGPLFGIPYGGLRYDIIAKCAQDPSQRIEYIAAWEVPLAIGRVIMMFVMMGVYHFLNGNDIALRIILFVICAIRILTYRFSTSTSVLREGEG